MMMENKYCVYKHTFKNGKVYIGITQQRPNERWKNGTGYKHNKHLTSAILKYGWDNIKHEILFDGLTKEEACQKEIELIAKYQSNNRIYGYNKSTGGETTKGFHFTEEMKEECRKRNLGKKHSEETKQKISKANKEHWKTHIKTAPEGTGYKIWTKRRKNGTVIPWNKGIHFEGKEVIQFDKNMNYINSYKSISLAQCETSVSSGHICECCKGKRKSAGGYIWRYAIECVKSPCMELKQFI